MQAKVKPSEKYKYIKGVYDEFIKMVSSTSFNLIDDGDLKDKIFDNYQKVQFRMNLQMTTCAIFDTQNDKTRLIDGLMRENVSRRLKEDCAYCILEDELKQKAVTDEIEKDVKIISSLKNHRKYFQNSSIFLSSNDYVNFFTKLHDVKSFEPDLIVLVLKSPTELIEEEIQYFINLVANEYNDGNFIIVFNDAGEKECIAIGFCEDCYPEETIAFLNASKIKLENRLFKVSTLLDYDSHDFDFIQVDPYSNTFKDLRDTIEEEMSLDCVLDRWNKNAVKVVDSMNEIQKTFNENQMKATINNYDVKLQENSEVLIEKIENIEKESEEKILKKKNNSNKETLKNFKNMYVEFQETFGKELINLEGNLSNINENKKVGKLAKEMYFKKHLKNKEVNVKIKGFVDNNFRDINWEELEEEQIPIEDLSNINKELYEKFKQSTSKTTKDIFAMAKSAFLAFIKSFKVKAVKKVDKIKKKVEKTVEECKKYKCPIEADNHIKKVRTIVDKEFTTIQQKLENGLALIQSIVQNLENHNIYPRFIGFYIIEKIDGVKISSAIRKLKEKLNVYIESTVSKDLSDRIYKHFQSRLYNVKEVDRCADLCHRQVVIFLGIVNDSKYYLTRGSVDIHNEDENLNGKNKTIQRRYLKKDEIVAQIETLRTKLFKYVMELNQKMNNLINETAKLLK